MKSGTHLCDAGSRQHASNARDKTLLAGRVEAAEALPRLLEVVLLQGTEQDKIKAVVTGHLCPASATPGSTATQCHRMTSAACHATR